MATQHRSITIERTPGGGHTVTNSRGGQLTFASGDDAAFTPVELLLAAIGRVHRPGRGRPDVPSGRAGGVPGGGQREQGA
ncbi:hypothetical protein ACFQX7_33655 [Luedemannella flava]